ncbi:hypothetical protein VFPPC_18154 [Pochonia chlamydosporia 170]|uniref:Uncharacterized protein n=1 Tax=Pochonia chlamydosporia 170 TaxID=1380566 RepID=A0A219AS67_METCM|nr:hypothetical protein VFPPC_18154 [Pochonia chlamydosporia 170]OWT43643.1 hypothetical protein VFPPC_18154 [Pochonia chlamydosporia 170]
MNQSRAARRRITRVHCSRRQWPRHATHVLVLVLVASDAVRNGTDTRSKDQPSSHKSLEIGRLPVLKIRGADVQEPLAEVNRPTCPATETRSHLFQCVYRAVVFSSSSRHIQILYSNFLPTCHDSLTLASISGIRGLRSTNPQRTELERLINPYHTAVQTSHL